MSDLVERCLEQIERHEASLRALAWFDAGRARRLAAAPAAGRLAGVPVGVKDIIDTAGVPTERGSPLFVGRVPRRSADVVRRVEAAGGLMLAKTVTAELAFAAPGPTRNPWDASRTPGGSSMGSPAAVATGMVPLALGTQTNSSIIMPAALCGVVGFKPSAGTLPNDGVMPFSPTLDQLGWFAGSVDGVARLAAALLGVEQAPAAKPLRLRVVRTLEWPGAAAAVRERFEADARALAAVGAELEEAELPAGFEHARHVHRTIMAFEAARGIGSVVEQRPWLASAVLLRFLREGAGVARGAYAAALTERDRLIARFTAFAAGCDAIVTPAAPDEAPGRETTGDPRFCTPWTLVGAPALVIPSGRGPGGLPIGLQLVAAPGRDAQLLAAGRVAAAVVGRDPAFAS